VKLSTTLFLAGIVALPIVGCGSGIPYSDGNRVGTVQKISKKGLFFPTWEGQLVMDGVRVKGTEGGVTNVWDFSVGTDDAIAAQIEKASEDGVRVKLHYEQHVVAGPSWGSTGYRVTKVERLQ
jgi:hypothetical protein